MSCGKTPRAVYRMPWSNFSRGVDENGELSLGAALFSLAPS